MVARTDIAPLNDPRIGADPGLPPQPAALLRNNFQLDKPIRAARLYVTAAGSYRISIDGHRVGETDLTPDFTDYRVRFAYQTYDVTALLHRGGNTLGGILGDGWFASPMTWAGSRNFPGSPALLAQLEIVFTDGTRQTIATSPEWKTSASPILSSEIYAGEQYDARLEQPGWDTPAFHAASSDSRHTRTNSGRRSLRADRLTRPPDRHGPRGPPATSRQRRLGL